MVQCNDEFFSYAFIQLTADACIQFESFRQILVFGVIDISKNLKLKVVQFIQKNPTLKLI